MSKFIRAAFFVLPVVVLGCSDEPQSFAREDSMSEAPQISEAAKSPFAEPEKVKEPEPTPEPKIPEISYSEAEIAAMQAKLQEYSKTPHDIAGIKIGLPLSTQRAAIAKLNPGYQIKNLTGDFTGLEARAYGNSGSVTDQFLALQNDAGIVWYIARVQAADSEDSYFLKEALDKSLTEKYGVEPGHLSFGGYYWSFDREGNRHTLNNCIISRGYKLEWQETIGESLTRFVPNSFSGNCGSVIEAAYRDVARERERLSGLYISMYDAKGMYDKLAAESAAAAKERERLHNEAVEKARNAKLPQL